MIRFLVVCSTLLVLTGCGRKGKLVRPEALVPAKSSDLRVMQRDTELQLTWAIPKRMVSGGKLEGLAGFRLSRMAGKGCPDCPDSWQQVALLDLEYLKGADREGERIFFRDTAVQAGTTYDYRLISYTKDASESPAATVSVTVRPPLPPPLLKALPTFTSVKLECSIPPLPAGHTATGCTLYRAQPGAPFPLVPYATLAGDGSPFEDTALEQGVVYSYGAAVAAHVDGEKIESAITTVTAGMARPE